MKMRIDRRALLAGLAASVAAPRYGFAASVMDATGRTITAPEHVLRVYPAGPPAAVELYTLAPDLLVGWVEPIRTGRARIPAARDRSAAASAALDRPWQRQRQSGRADLA